MFLGEEDELKAIGGSSGVDPTLFTYLPLTETAGVNALDTRTGQNWTYLGSPTLGQLPGPGDGLPWPLFDGIDDAVNPSVTALAAMNAPGGFNPDELTIAFWAQISNITFWNNATHYVLTTIGANGNNFIYLLKSGANTLRWEATLGGTWGIAAAQIWPVSTIAPFHIALTLSKLLNEAVFYFNGVATALPTAYPSGVWAGALTAGWTQIGAPSIDNAWHGNMGRVRYYNRALPAAEIADLAVSP